MIVELFGPPASGKTTLAKALTAQLRERGHRAELILSYRPAERLPPSHGVPVPPRLRSSAVIWRLSRPIVEAVTTACHALNKDDLSLAGKLLRVLPARNVVWSIRLRQYIARLSRTWTRASEADHLVLFDQAFIQVVCSLVLLARASDETLIAQALDLVPKSDILVRLGAPRDVLESRLRDRDRRQGTLERLLELDLQTNLDSVPIIDRLHDLLQAREREIVQVYSVDSTSVRRLAEALEEKLIAARAASARTDRMGERWRRHHPCPATNEREPRHFGPYGMAAHQGSSRSQK
jgi:hypothetical protein